MAAGPPLLWLHDTRGNLWTPGHDALSASFISARPSLPGFDDSTTLDGIDAPEDVVFWLLDLLRRGRARTARAARLRARRLAGGRIRGALPGPAASPGAGRRLRPQGRLAPLRPTSSRSPHPCFDRSCSADAESELALSTRARTPSRPSASSMRCTRASPRRGSPGSSRTTASSIRVSLAQRSRALSCGAPTIDSFRRRMRTRMPMPCPMPGWSCSTTPDTCRTSTHLLPSAKPCANSSARHWLHSWSYAARWVRVQRSHVSQARAADSATDRADAGGARPRHARRVRAGCTSPSGTAFGRLSSGMARSWSFRVAI